jgi:hypothetical protein
VAEPRALSDPHRKMLEESGIRDSVIEARGYRTVADPKELIRLGYSEAQAKQVPGLLYPSGASTARSSRTSSARIHREWSRTSR